MNATRGEKDWPEKTNGIREFRMKKKKKSRRVELTRTRGLKPEIEKARSD